MFNREQGLILRVQHTLSNFFIVSLDKDSIIKDTGRGYRTYDAA
jgi:hypothetical protein